jgi:serine protease
VTGGRAAWTVAALALVGVAPPAYAGPRGDLPRPRAVVWEQGRATDRLIVKWRDPTPAVLRGRTFAPLGRLGAKGWHVVRADDALALGDALLDDPRVEQAYLAFLPAPPPFGDTGETDTPDFRALQGWLDPFPGLDALAGWGWPGGDGAGVTVADVEYDWDPLHEDLSGVPDAFAAGLASGYYAFHGTSVLGMLVAGDNGYGVLGAVPAARVLMVSPYTDDGTYSVAVAVAEAAARLAPGDVLLIEQQAYAGGTFGPVSVEPAVWDAIADAVDAGIVVVEPGGNGGLDLDAEAWDGWFDRAENDHGGILVGGGAPPDARVPRGWVRGGSSFGARVDVQGWFSGIVTSSGLDTPGYADLYAPDTHRAYTRSFGGTSGASPMVVAAAVALQGARRAAGLPPLPPESVRGAIVGTGTPQQGDAWIGPQPDVRRLLRTWMSP